MCEIFWSRVWRRSMCLFACFIFWLAWGLCLYFWKFAVESRVKRSNMQAFKTIPKGTKQPGVEVHLRLNFFMAKFSNKAICNFGVPNLNCTEINLSVGAGSLTRLQDCNRFLRFEHVYHFWYFWNYFLHFLRLSQRNSPRPRPHRQNQSAQIRVAYSLLWGSKCL